MKNRICRLICTMLLFSLVLTGCGHGDPGLSELTVPSAATEAPMETQPETLPETEAPPEIAPIHPLTPPAPETVPTESVPAETGPDPDLYRPAYNRGSCRRMEGTVYVVTFLVDDVSSSWTEESGREFLLRCVTPGLDYLEQRAGDWGVSLEFDYYFFQTDGEYSMYYPYEFSPDLTGAVDNYDVLDVIARNFGFEERFAMNDYFEDYFGTDEVLYFVALNKEGHSYTMPDSEDDGYDLLEYSAFFTGHTGGTPNGAFVVAHETMHSFGAEDYYDPYGDYPHRKALAETMYPDDLMMRWDDDVNNLYVSDATAFTVGWIDEIPASMATEQWWS